MHGFERYKLEAQSIQCALMGYTHSYEGFVCKDLSKQRFCIFRNVTFFMINLCFIIFLIP